MRAEDQAEYWNRVAGPTWAADQSLIDAAFRDYSHALLAHANPRPGERVIDVGCGCGTTTIAAARRCGFATGLDISRPMLQQARRLARAAAVAAEFLEVDAASHRRQDGSIDLIISQFGLMFFDSPRQAFSNMFRWLSPGGRLVALCWQNADNNPWLMLPGQVARAYVDVPTAHIEDSAIFSLGEAGSLVTLLVDAGFSEVRLKSIAYPLRVEGALERGFYFFVERAPLTSSLMSVDGATCDTALQALRDAIAVHHDGTGVALTGAAWLVEAIRAASPAPR